MDNIGYLLQHLSVVLSKQSEKVLLERLGIGFSQFKLLMVLDENSSELTQKSLAAQLGQTEASVSRQIVHMVDKGLIKTTLNPRDKRQKRITATTKGVRLANEAFNVLNKYHAGVFESISEKRRARLLETLELMHSQTCKRGRSNTCILGF